MIAYIGTWLYNLICLFFIFTLLFFMAVDNCDCNINDPVILIVSPAMITIAIIVTAITPKQNCYKKKTLGKTFLELHTLSHLEKQLSP